MVQRNKTSFTTTFNKALQRENERCINTFNIISASYAFFLLVTYIVYILSLPQTASISYALTIGYYLAVFSPLVTIADPIIMTWYLTRDVAGSLKYRCPYCNKVFDDIKEYVNHLDDCPQKPEQIENLEEPES